MAQSSTSGNLRNGLIDFVAGSLGGVAVVYVGQPLDTVKVKMQTFPHLYKNMFDCLKQTLRNDGVIRGLYAGTTPAIIANVAENSVLFAAYGYCQKFVCAVTETEKVEDLSTMGNASAGFLAAFFSSFTLCPTELIKCQLQARREVNIATAQTAVIKDGTSAPNSSVSGSTTPSQNGGTSASSSPTPSPTPAKDSQAVSTTHGEQNNLENRKDVTESSRASTSNIKESTPEIPLPKTETKQVNIGPLQLTQQIFRQYGIQGLFRGLVPTIMREMPGYFFFFGGYEGTREVLRKPGQSKDDIGLVRTMIAGAVGGLVLWTIIFPTDVIKSRVQISNKKQKFLNVGYEIVKKEGVLALYNGLKPTLVRTIPATAALFVVYEYSKKLMHHSFGD